jgi:Luciferase-like monooxygenase
VRFGIGHLPCGSRAEFAAAADRAEGLGFDFLAAPDHLGIASPFAGLVAAGMVTRRIRLRTYVLNSCFLNPALLVREAATADLLTDGRLELGLGAGHMKAEFDDAGIPWRRLGARGRAMSTRGLAVAADHADIVSFSGLRQLKDGPPGAFTVATSDQTDDSSATSTSAAAGGLTKPTAPAGRPNRRRPAPSGERARERGTGPRAGASARLPIRAARSRRPGSRGGAAAPQRAPGLLEHHRVLAGD